MSYRAQIRYARSSIDHVVDWASQTSKCLATATRSVDFPQKDSDEIFGMKIQIESIAGQAGKLQERMDKYFGEKK